MARGRAVTSSMDEARPYPPSWLDALQARIDRSSPSPYLVYALAWALHFALVTAVDGWSPASGWRSPRRGVLPDERRGGVLA